MFGDTELKELQVRKAGVLVDCATDRLLLKSELQRANAGFDRFRKPFSWFESARSFFGGGPHTDSPPAERWNLPVMVQSALKAYAAYQAVRGFFARRREKKREARR